MESSLLKDILKRNRENKLAHAFLLETNDSTKCYEDVIELVKNLECPFDYNEKCDKDCNVCHLIENDNLPSFIVINAEGQYIKKDQILEMMEKFNTKPVFTKYNIYVIREAERFNSSSANTLLKFLEEPEDGIIGIFITENKENVISTIRSRCQIFRCDYHIDISDKVNEDILQDVKNYLNAIYKNPDDLVYNKTHMSGYYKERMEWEIFFYTMLYYMKDSCIENKFGKISMLENMSKNNVIRIIFLITDVLKYIKSNGNIDLILDKFVIEMRQYYE